MIATFVQKSNILDILEIRSNRPSAICYPLEVVKFKMLYLMTLDHMVIENCCDI